MTRTLFVNLLVNDVQGQVLFVQGYLLNATQLNISSALFILKLAVYVVHNQNNTHPTQKNYALSTKIDLNK